MEVTDKRQPTVEPKWISKISNEEKREAIQPNDETK